MFWNKLLILNESAFFISISSKEKHKFWRKLFFFDFSSFFWKMYIFIRKFFHQIKNFLFLLYSWLLLKYLLENKFFFRKNCFLYLGFPEGLHWGPVHKKCVFKGHVCLFNGQFPFTLFFKIKNLLRNERFGREFLAMLYTLAFLCSLFFFFMEKLIMLIFYSIFRIMQSFLKCFKGSANKKFAKSQVFQLSFLFKTIS